MSKSTDELFKNVISHAKEYGFVFPSSEIYDGLSAVYDYGQNGVELKNNIKTYWWKSMVQMHENIVGIDSAIFMHPKIWKASGHVDGFSDPMIDNKVTKKRYRADQLIEDEINALVNKAIDEARIETNEKYGVSIQEIEFPIVIDGKIEAHKMPYNDIISSIDLNSDSKITNIRSIYFGSYVKEFQWFFTKVLNSNWFIKADKANFDLNDYLINEDLKGLKDLIIRLEIADPNSKEKPDWTDVRQFNLMFSTQMGAVADDADVVYLRPETAQGNRL